MYVYIFSIYNTYICILQTRKDHFYNNYCQKFSCTLLRQEDIHYH